jgi:hypothetical protein
MKGRIAPSCLGLAVLVLWTVTPALAQNGAPAAGAEKHGHVAGTEKHAHAAEGHEAAPAVHDHAEESHAEHGEEAGFIVRGAYLLMQPRRRAMDFAIVSPVANGSPIGNLVEVPWESTSGFRAGLGYRLPGDGWEIGLEYTYLFTDSTRTEKAPLGGTLFVTLAQPPMGFLEADTAAARNLFLYNVLDLVVGRRFSVGESTSLWLGGGGRFAWIKQELTAAYDGATVSQASISSPIDFDGYGLRVGGEGQWNISEKLSLFAKAFGSLVVGDFDTSLLQTRGAGTTTDVSLSDHFRKVVPVAELGVGLGWQGEAFRFRVGYELTNWFGLVDSPDLVNELNKPSRRTSDLSIDGLAIEVQFIY